jgi:hypothetical protein
VGTLTGSLKAECAYGPLSVENIAAGFESIEVSTRYAGIKLGIADNANYQLNGHSRYGGIKYNDGNFNMKQRIQENNSLTINGIMGKDASPKAIVNIEASYASVTLFQ